MYRQEIAELRSYIEEEPQAILDVAAFVICTIQT